MVDCADDAEKSNPPPIYPVQIVSYDVLKGAWLGRFMKSDIPKPPALCTASATFAFAYPIIGALHMNGAVVLGNHFCKTLAAIVLVF